MRKFIKGLGLGMLTIVYLVAKLLGFKTPTAQEAESFFDDGLVRIPVRFKPDILVSMLEGWFPLGFGGAHLNQIEDGSFDLIFQAADVSQAHNLVKLDIVQQALMASLDLVNAVHEEGHNVSDETRDAAREVERLVQRAGN